MAKAYLDQLTVLLEQSTSGGFKGIQLECKHFFSGAAVYVNGKIALSLTPAGFAIKLSEKSRKVLFDEHGAGPLRYFTKGPIKKEYVVLPESMLSDIVTLRHWVEMSIEYVLSTPASENAQLK